MSEQQSATLERDTDRSGIGASEQPALEWLRAESITVSLHAGESADGEERPLWRAMREGHHPQSELTAAKLHSRLADYLDREGRRHPSSN